MSNIYIQEPPTSGKVLLVTGVGDIDIELWSKETPKACRNFVQLCLENYYNNTIFHRVVRDFIVQGGDPTGTGTGGESIYGKPFKDEFHSRLRFVRRGLVCMANAGQHDNGSQFFFTMGATPELNNKHTIFGKVSGKTVYNMLKLQEVEVGADDRPPYPIKIIRTEVLSNPFDDIIPRVTKKPKSDSKEDKKKSKSKATKNFSLLSFGEEAEEDEVEVDKATQDMKGKSKSSHDLLLNDKKLSTVPAVDSVEGEGKKRKAERSESGEEKESSQEEGEIKEGAKEKVKEEIVQNIHKKLKRDNEIPKKESSTEKNSEKVEDKVKDSTQKKKSKDSDSPRDLEDSKSDTMSEKDAKEQRKEDLRKEIQQLKEELIKKKRTLKENKPSHTEKSSNDDKSEVNLFKESVDKYKTTQKQIGKRGSSERESLTLSILEKFHSKLQSAQRLAGDYSDGEDSNTEDKQQDIENEQMEEDNASDISWMRHKLIFNEDLERKVFDANIDDSERYEIFDPRNPLNKRRREESAKVMKDKR